MSFGDFICLGVDAALLSLLYVLYKNRKTCLDAIRDAPVLEIDKSLRAKVLTASGQSLPYAVIKGSVKAIDQPIVSSHNSIKGVVQETLVTEHKMKWSYVSRFWTEIERDVANSTNSVPFVLLGPDKKSSVEVVSPLQASTLSMMTIHDAFQPNKSGAWDALTSFFVGERSKGFRHIEKMLTEGTTLTGVGALSLDDGKVIITPPSNSYLYHLSTDTEKQLIKSLESEVKTFKAFCTILSLVGGSILAFILFKYYRQYRRKLERDQERQRLNDVITHRNEEPEERSQESTCLICLTNPREVLILDCGHFCCCADCGQILDPYICPICRGPILRLVPAYIS